MFQVGGCGSRFDSHLHSPTHQRSVVQTGLGSSVFNQTTSTLLLPRESPRSQTPSGLISTKGQRRTQKAPFCRDQLGKGRWWGGREGLPSTEGPRAGSHPSLDCDIAGDLRVLLFTGVEEEEERLGQSTDTAEKRLAQTLAHVSVRSGVVAPRGEAAAKPCAVPDLRQRSLRVIQRRGAPGSCQSSTRGSRARLDTGTLPRHEHSTPCSQLTHQGAAGDCTRWK